MPESGRETVLARVREALGSVRSTVDVPRDYRPRGEHSPGSAELLELLTDRLVDYKATVLRCAADAVAATVASAVPAGARFVVPPGLPAEWVPPGAVTDPGDLTPYDLDAFDRVLTGCTVAAAETGTIALDGSAGQGRRAISLVPDLHVCVVLADQVVQTVPELIGRLDPHRPLTLISGPSATSDIELHRVEGVHGPRTLVVVLAG
ncbi:LUD domain-containing protein [Virgisporangium ochraceum]